VTTYSSHFHGPRAGGELHVVVVDNGRSRMLSDEHHRRALACIRCGACMNTCPVYRRSGGYSYGWTVPGPIGSILATGRDAGAHYTLPYASSLCGSCTDVCPVKIDLHEQILERRHELAARGLVSAGKRLQMRLLGLVLRVGALYALAGALARLALRHLPRSILYSRWNAWGRQRELPPPPRESFRAAWRRRGASRG
jgi:L-lactate dehydrogenase complex protein LldF